MNPIITSSRPLTILVADDDELNQLILNGLLKEAGHRVITVHNGAEAVQYCKENKPDLIIMDVMMPVMDGYEATQQIKELFSDTFIPIIFLTAISEEAALSKCINIGGDDFLTKPFTVTILMAKIKAMMRLTGLYTTIRRHQLYLVKEQEAAKRVFTKMFPLDSLKREGIRYKLSSMSLFNGDVLMAGDHPDGSLTLMLADATGHGLPAALGTMPMIDMFYSECQQGTDPVQILKSLNNTLKERLPVEYMMCVGMVHLCADRSRADIWNAGLPEIAIYSDIEQRLVGKVVATSLPLGIRESEMIDWKATSFNLQVGDRIFIHSDGISEATNLNGDRFGKSRVDAQFQFGPLGETIFDHLLEALSEFTAGVEQSDDLTIIEYTIS